MASADCTCCGAPATVGDPVPAEIEDCDCGCDDCDDCYDCYHDEDLVEYILPVVLCDGCTEDGEDCGPETWHCRCGRACDGSACPGSSPGEHYQAYADYVRGADDGDAP